MIEQLYQVQSQYNELLEATKKEKANIKKSIPKLEKLKIQNEELGLSIEGFAEKIEENEKALEDYNKEIVKYKKVIHRLGVCLNIMLENDTEEVATEIIEEDEE